MPTVKFKVKTNYKQNTYQIISEDKEHSYYNTLCTSLGMCMSKIYQITRDLQLKHEKAVFTFE